ncbi:MAG: MFS transporter [Chloroflexi bacterium]|nr:MFS transporter [Chloroflexota bacterium]
MSRPAPVSTASPSAVAAPLARSQTAAFGHLLFALAALAALMSSIDYTIVAVAIPQLVVSFDTSLALVSWTLTSYQLVQLIMLPLSGKLSDSFGRKRVFLFCVGIFTVGSLLCAVAPNIWFLIVARGVQAVGGGGLLPSSVGIVAEQYPLRRAQAIGLLTSMQPIGSIIGPNLGGFILEHWTWREMFIINVPIGAAVVLGVGLILRERRVKRTVRHIDVPGLALYGSAITLLLLSLTAAGDDPSLWQGPFVWLGIAISLVLFVAFLWWIKHARDPVMEYRLVAQRPYLAVNIYNLLFGAAVFGFFSFLPTYAVLVFGLDPFLSGAVLTPRAIVMVITSIVTSVYIIKLGYRIPMLLGMGLVALMLVILGQAHTQIQVGSVTFGGFWFLASILLLSAVGNGLSTPSSSNAAIDMAPERAAALTGIRNMFRLTGGVISIAAMVVALTLFSDQALGLATIFGWLAIPVLLAAPLAFAIPNAPKRA